MNKNYVYAHTETKKNYKEDKKITSKQWQVYYYLLSISYYNSKSIENHRYVYKKDFSVSAAAKFLGISRPTIYTALSNLEKNNLLYDDKNDDAYLIYAKNWVKINNKVLKPLLSLSAKESKNVDILRVYLILKKIYELAKSKNDMTFTKKDLIEMLGHGITNACEYDSIRGYLALLSFIKLIEIKSHTEYQDGLGNFVIYHLQSINDEISDGELISNIQAEVMNSRLPDYIKENFENFL